MIYTDNYIKDFNARRAAFGANKQHTVVSNLSDTDYIYIPSKDTVEPFLEFNTINDKVNNTAFNNNEASVNAMENCIWTVLFEDKEKEHGDVYFLSSFIHEEFIINKNMDYILYDYMTQIKKVLIGIAKGKSRTLVSLFRIVLPNNKSIVATHKVENFSYPGEIDIVTLHTFFRNITEGYEDFKKTGKSNNIYRLEDTKYNIPLTKDDYLYKNNATHEVTIVPITVKDKEEVDSSHKFKGDKDMDIRIRKIISYGFTEFTDKFKSYNDIVVDVEIYLKDYVDLGIEYDKVDIVVKFLNEYKKDLESSKKSSSVRKRIKAARAIVTNLEKIKFTYIVRPDGYEFSKKSPHDRTGHWRTCKSGKRVWVNKCRIHKSEEAA